MTPTVIEKMIENLSGELPGTADLHDLSDSARFQIVDIPSNDFLLVIAKNNLSEISVGLDPVHEREEPAQRLAIVLRPERVTTSEFVEQASSVSTSSSAACRRGTV